MGPRTEATEPEGSAEFSLLESIDKSLKQVCWLLLMILAGLGGVVGAVLSLAK